MLDSLVLLAAVGGGYIAGHIRRRAKADRTIRDADETQFGTPGFKPGAVIKGVKFDPSVHKVDGRGWPVLGAKDQLLLNPEARKRALARRKKKAPAEKAVKKAPVKKAPVKKKAPAKKAVKKVPVKKKAIPQDKLEELVGALMSD